ncbi:hypothetical protein BOTBODRAFT_32632 [Botryobasidium botryosum FD-172 SS1]|uniref:Uncharacterized protein n=1 Tax=Botryobasidium botryosum (strain FD-172 SS1) TaxID=930990 RepID=A0A067MSF7_BOTB1|nr:hypothetical protein BOTBODRAFT_32632 [Botryobasidium botryosum FD-172 SS1]
MCLLSSPFIAERSEQGPWKGDRNSRAKQATILQVPPYSCCSISATSSTLVGSPVAGISALVSHQIFPGLPYQDMG